MVEPWALQLSFKGISVTNPDQPFAQIIKKNSSKQDHTSIASIQYVQSQTCLHQFFATYLGDKSRHGEHFHSMVP
ncbi:hypothetical protein JVU11DRAFT_6241 [Chiua virens]|nr:hypothetical protein JVU11DRAFT_6241 [Chiua virens]